MFKPRMGRQQIHLRLSLSPHLRIGPRTGVMAELACSLRWKWLTADKDEGFPESCISG
jgi:hypothetical protein